MTTTRLYIINLYCIICGTHTWHLFREDGVFECLSCRLTVPEGENEHARANERPTELTRPWGSHDL